MRSAALWLRLTESVTAGWCSLATSQCADQQCLLSKVAASCEPGFSMLQSTNELMAVLHQCLRNSCVLSACPAPGAAPVAGGMEQY